MRRGNFSKVYKGELVEVKLEEKIKDNPIIIDELSVLNDSVLKKTMMRTKTLIKIETGGSCTPLPEV